MIPRRTLKLPNGDLDVSACDRMILIGYYSQSMQSTILLPSMDDAKQMAQNILDVVAEYEKGAQ